MSKHKGLRLNAVYGQKEPRFTIFSLGNFPENSIARVVQVIGNGSLRQRLLDLGFTQNTIIKVKGAAPLGDPIMVSLRGTTVALRRDEAKNIIVEDFALQKD